LVAHPKGEVLARRERFEQRLQDVAPADLDVLDFVDRAHAPGAEQLENAVRRSRDDLVVLVLARPAGLGHRPPQSFTSGGRAARGSLENGSGSGRGAGACTGAGAEADHLSQSDASSSSIASKGSARTAASPRHAAISSYVFALSRRKTSRV